MANKVILCAQYQGTKFVFPDELNQFRTLERCRSLEIGKYYKIENVKIQKGFEIVYLHNFSSYPLNGAAFKYFDLTMNDKNQILSVKAHNIYRDPKFNPYLMER